MQNSTKKLKKSEIQLFNRENVLAIFDEKIEIRERCKGAPRLVGTPLCPVGRVFCSEPCIGPLQLNRSTRAIGTLYHMSFLTQLTVRELLPIYRSSNDH